METQKSTLKTKTPAIYYVVKGRGDVQKKEYFEQVFADENPILAREKAFLFYQHYAQILHDEGIIQLQYPKGINPPYTEEIDLKNPHQAQIKYSTDFAFENGIGLYMVVKKSIIHLKIRNKIDDRYLIHGFWNLNLNHLIKMIQGLTIEYAYYERFKYETKNYVSEKEWTYAHDFKVYKTILSTPFDWENSNQLNKIVQDPISKDLKGAFLDCISNGVLTNNAFIPTFDLTLILNNILSLFNTHGGYLFCGIDPLNRVACKVFDENDTPYLLKILNEFITDKLGLACTKQIKMSMILVNKILVLVITVPASNQKVIQTQINKKVIYFRDGNGMFQQIVNNQTKPR